MSEPPNSKQCARGKTVALLSALAITGCGVTPGENASVPAIPVPQSAKAVAACVHTALEKRIGTELRTEDFSFKGEYRFTHVIGLSVVAGIGNAGSFTPWSVSVLDRPPGSVVVLNAGEPYRSRLLEWLAPCGVSG